MFTTLFMVFFANSTAGAMAFESTGSRFVFTNGATAGANASLNFAGGASGFSGTWAPAGSVNLSFSSPPSTFGGVWTMSSDTPVLNPFVGYRYYAATMPATSFEASA